MNNDFEKDPSPETTLDKVTTLASDRCHQVCDHAKEVVRKNPVPTVLGALVFGAAVGYLVLSRRPSESYTDRVVREALSARNRLAATPSRLSSILHDGLESASRGAGRASSFLHDLPTDDVLSSISHSLNRVSNRLKFW